MIKHVGDDVKVTYGKAHCICTAHYDVHVRVRHIVASPTKIQHLGVWRAHVTHSLTYLCRLLLSPHSDILWT